MSNLGDPPATPTPPTQTQKNMALLAVFAMGGAVGYFIALVANDRALEPMKYGDKCYDQHGRLIR